MTSRDRFVPEITNGFAAEGDRQWERDGPADQKHGEHDPNDGETMRLEDAMVQKQN